jgi:HD-GYP domain-containing protein (c-di-GMP phosphodiesterase class II)
LRDRIGAAVRGWGDQLPSSFELFDGCRLIPVRETGPDGQGRLAVALALGSAALATDAFDDVCRSARLEPTAARRTLSRLARYDAPDIEPLAGALHAMHGDLIAVAGHERSLGVFSEELAEAYEQITLLYTLGRSMNWLTKPGDFVETACELLVELLDFKWIAIASSTSRPPRLEQASHVVAGALPCPRSAFEAEVTRSLCTTPCGAGRMLHEPGEYDLATLIGSQVVAVPIKAGADVTGLLLAGSKTTGDPDVTSIETQLLDATADYLSAFLHNVGLYAEQREMFVGTIRALSAAIDAKDHYTRGHSERVAVMAWRLAQAFGMSDEEAERVRIAGIVHDVGKIGVRETVLRKPGRLTDEEFEQVKQHPRVGHTILKDIAPLADVLPGVLHHHERWDGRGYPDGLAGDRIPQLGRLLAVADSFDAMSSNRAYRPALPREKVLAEIAECAGTQFDPRFAEVFLTLDLAEYDRMVANHRAQESEAA